MTRSSYTIEFITPCFLGGADPAQAELRAASIRGQLHWWYRMLGGSREQELADFGSIDPDRSTASTFSVRTRQLPGNSAGPRQEPLRIQSQGVSPTTYLLGFFCGRTGRLDTGGHLPPGSRAELTFLHHSPPSDRLKLAIQTFLRVGSLGFRSRRTAGAFNTDREPLTITSWEETVRLLETSGFQARLLEPVLSGWRDACNLAGIVLKEDLRRGLGISAGRNGSAANPLGSATPRQSSAVILRPVRFNNDLRLLALECPHHRTLGPDALRHPGSRGSILKRAFSDGH